MNLTDWKIKYPGLVHYSEMTSNYVTFLEYDIRFPSDNTHPYYYVYLEYIKYEGSFYTDGIAENWNVTTRTGLVGGDTHFNEAISLGEASRMYMTLTSATNGKFPLLDTTGLPGNNFDGTPYRIYRTGFTHDIAANILDDFEILSKNPIRGDTAYFTGDAGGSAWAIYNATLHTKAGINFTLTGTFYDIPSAPPPPPPPPPTPTGKFYLMRTDDGGILLDDDASSLTSDFYLIN